MNNEMLRKIQLTQLEIYKVVYEIAERNQIPIYLAGGTLLGAVRHKGFIPWDDDLDVMLLRNDYERLMSCLKRELPKEYWLQNYETDEQFWQPIAKVRKKGTLYKESALKEIHDEKCGIWIDIFALDSASKNRGWLLKLRKQIVQGIGFALKRKILKQSLKSFSRRHHPSVLFWSLFPANKLKKIQIHFMKNGCMGLTKYYVSLASPYRIEKEAYPPSWFSGCTKIMFEDQMFIAPDDYDGLLTQLYGDYMTPPPEDRRNGHNVDGDYPIIV